ncbi:LPS export ABC transporter permease LptG [Paremcibacter congregatus]|uniref:LPS export ABC transporter permease LptG n=1 Tax=Paremcibacter congregatus TaxID=2043170 RepID=A0A2G4YNC8_9PROT|nr:LPS export ABC transporter permease LptG [Paremcibacter congregatus]PHZ83831.1 LPS export ABC transporter permease LptG [Paremcibacter congregatus]QDE27535.1 LPS export ABC transporter permease LptG [Paremcibacter congregatus]
MERFIKYSNRLGGMLNPGSLDLYLAKSFASRYIIILLGLVATLQMLDLLSESDNILAGEGAVTGDLWHYVTLRVPTLLSLFSPFVALLAAIMCLAGLNVHSEIVIMKAAGWSAFRIITPLILMSLLIASLHFVFTETISVKARAELRNWKENNYAADLPPAPDTVYDAWVNDGNNLIKAESASRNGSILLLDKVTQYIRDKDLRITSLIRADFAVYRDGKWKMFEVKEFDMRTSKVTPMENLVWETDIPPERFIALALKPDQVNLQRLRSAIAQLKTEGHDTASFETMLHQKFVGPLSTLLMPLLAGLAAFGLHRGGGLFGRIALTGALGFGYFVINNLFAALGQYGAVPPAVSAWLPFTLFFLIGISFILVTEE